MSQSSTYIPGSGGGGIVTQINGDTGSATGPIITFLGAAAAGSTVQFNGAVSTILFEVTDGSGNTIMGNGAGNGTISGSTNTALGKDAMAALTTGDNNIAIGYQAMGGTTAGSNNIIIGGGDASVGDLGDSNIVIGLGGPEFLTPGASNVIAIGNDSSTCVIGGINGVDVGNTVRVVTTGGSQANQLGSADLTAGTGITITPTANTITIASTGMGSFAWSVITADQAASVNNGYICNKAGTLALALPATSAVGDVIEVTNENTALGIQFTQAAGQQILIGNSSTTSGATGTLTSSAVGDSLRLVCKTANLTWRVTSGWGNWVPA